MEICALIKGDMGFYPKEFDIIEGSQVMENRRNQELMPTEGANVLLMKWMMIGKSGFTAYNGGLLLLTQWRGDNVC